jgi:hypothetical protein
MLVYMKFSICDFLISLYLISGYLSGCTQYYEINMRYENESFNLNSTIIYNTLLEETKPTCNIENSQIYGMHLFNLSVLRF